MSAALDLELRDSHYFNHSWSTSTPIGGGGRLRCWTSDYTAHVN